MNFLSIDIGIKNLGFAIYYKIDSEATALDFGLYNINDEIKDHTNSKTNIQYIVTIHFQFLIQKFVFFFLYNFK